MEKFEIAPGLVIEVNDITNAQEVMMATAMKKAEIKTRKEKKAQGFTEPGTEHRILRIPIKR